MSIHAEIWKRIKKYDHIIITSHLRADGDCVGSAIGLREIIKATFPKKDVKAIHENIDYLSFLGKSDEATDEEREEIIDMYLDSLDIKRKNIEEEIKGDEELNIISERLRFTEALARGDIKLEKLDWLRKNNVK